MGLSRPRIIIVGAGMAGLSSASRLLLPSSPPFHLTLLEASSRLGGRIFSSSFAGDHVELGATWIHGIDGSPVYDIAERIAALQGDCPWERQDGFPQDPVTRAEGGFVVEPQLMEPVVDAFKKAISEVKSSGAAHRDDSRSSCEEKGSIGLSLRQGLSDFLSQQDNVSEMEKRMVASDGYGFRHGDGLVPRGWTVQSLQESVFAMLQDMERIGTASNSLYDVDLESEKEYEEFPGRHITIGKGYISVLNELARSLPAGTIQFGKKVQKVFWNHSHPFSPAPVVLSCDDGSLIEADHVILTMSLGVLKSSTSLIPSEGSEGDGVCRSVHELRGRLPNEGDACQLFEPSLPVWKLRSISRLGFGVVDKLFLSVDPSAEERIRCAYTQFLYHRDSAKDGLIPRWMRRTFSMCPIYKGSNVLLCWFAGEEAMAMEGLGDEEVIEGVVEVLARFGLGWQEEEEQQQQEEESSDSEDGDGDGEGERERRRARLRRMFRGVLRSRWGSNPLSQGSYTFVATGASGLDIEALAQPLPPSPSHLCSPSPSSSSSSSSPSSSASSSSLSEEDDDDFSSFQPSPLQLLFAGEATHRHFYSTTHGAFLSGVREADRLIQLYSSSSSPLVPDYSLVEALAAAK